MTTTVATRLCGDGVTAESRRLRIAIIAPPWAPVPPPLFGGIESVVNELAVGLQRGGHEVLLYTTGDSTCPVPRQWVLPEAEADRIGHVAPELRHVMHAYEAVQHFDVVHDHTILGPHYAERLPDLPVVSTIHGPLDDELADPYARVSNRVDLIAISKAQAAAAPDLAVSRIIPHGLDVARFPDGRGNGGYCVFLGRMCADKGAHRALEVARRAGAPLVLAGKMRTQAERDYFEAEIRPHLDEEKTWYVGEVSHQRKLDILANAWCLLFPIRWPEPFGLVMVESLACGTPVLAFPEGAAPEVVDHARTGFLCADEAEMAEAVGHVGEIDRQVCRRAVETRFSSQRMVDQHLELFHEVVERSRTQSGPTLTADRDGGPAIDLRTGAEVSARWEAATGDTAAKSVVVPSRQARVCVSGEHRAEP